MQTTGEQNTVLYVYVRTWPKMQAYYCLSPDNTRMLFLYSDIYWIDAGVPLEKYISLKPYQVHIIYIYTYAINPVL